jgi:hypothetical protein
MNVIVGCTAETLKKVSYRKGRNFFFFLPSHRVAKTFFDYTIISDKFSQGVLEMILLVMEKKMVTHILSKYFKHTLLVLFWSLPSKMHTGERGKRGKGHLMYPLE